MKARNAVVFAAVAAVGVFVMRTADERKYRSTAADALRRQGRLLLSQEQQAMADIITGVFADAGMRWLADAAIANAYAESLLDTTAIGDAGAAVGLFQLNDARPSAAGYGMSVAERQDPVENTRRIVDVARVAGADRLKNSPGYRKVVWFAREVERCAACGHNAGDSELYRRCEIAARLFGMSALS